MLRDRRDEALLRLMFETGCRAGEVAVMSIADVDLGTGVAIVRRGKGGKGRSVPFGPHTTRALDRYIRARRTRRRAAEPMGPQVSDPRAGGSVGAGPQLGVTTRSASG
jgi:integrase/recombinase XerD